MLSNFDRDQLELARRIAEDLYAELVAKVIAEIKAFPPEARLSGDDSVLADVWEEFKYQIQRGESPFFDAYEDSIRAICAGLVAELPCSLQGLLWLWSDAYIDWDGPEDDDEQQIPYGDPVTDGLENELWRRVRVAADDEPLAIDPDDPPADDEPPEDD
ncbi:MAG: hypothetical protein ACK51N_04485 [bacterium]